MRPGVGRLGYLNPPLPHSPFHPLLLNGGRMNQCQTHARCGLLSLPTRRFTPLSVSKSRAADTSVLEVYLGVDHVKTRFGVSALRKRKITEGERNKRGRRRARTDRFKNRGARFPHQVRVDRSVVPRGRGETAVRGPRLKIEGSHHLSLSLSRFYDPRACRWTTIKVESGPPPRVQAKYCPCCAIPAEFGYPVPFTRE